MRLSVNVTGTEQVRSMLREIGEVMTRRALDATAVEVERYVEQQAGRHFKTGALNDSIYKRRTNDGWEIAHDLRRAPHAVFVHWGTKPHTIKPRKKKALRWAAGGRFFFAASVRHPGIKPDKWMVRAAQLAPRIFADQVQQRLRRI